MECIFTNYLLSNNNKVLFIEKTKQQIKLFYLLLERIEILKSTLLDFNGKVLNIRFKKAFSAMLEQQGRTGTSLQTIEYDSYFQRYEAKFTIGFYGEERCFYVEKQFKGYLSVNEWTFSIIVDVNKRIKANESIDLLDENISVLKEKIATMKDCIDNYDKYAEKSLEIERLINEYKKSVHRMLQLNILVGRPCDFTIFN